MPSRTDFLESMAPGVAVATVAYWVERVQGSGTPPNWRNDVEYEKLLADRIRQIVEKHFAPEHHAAVLAEFKSMQIYYGDVPPLLQIQMALVDLSDGDPNFIVSREYQQADWRDLILGSKLLSKERQLQALDITTLLEMLEGIDTRLEALTALKTKGSAALPAIPRLLELLQDSDQLLVTKVLRTLESIGPTAQQAVPVLLKLGSDEDYLIRLHARAALRAVAPSAAESFEDSR